MPQNQKHHNSRQKVDPNLKKSAEKMEAMFLKKMFDVMRKTVPESQMSLQNQATDIYRGMLDQKIADKAASLGGNIGLAEEIVEHYQRGGYNQIREPRGTGGTYESQSQSSSSPAREKSAGTLVTTPTRRRSHRRASR